MKKIEIKRSINRLTTELKKLDVYVSPIFESLESTEIMGAVQSDYEVKITRVVCAIEDLKRRIDEPEL